MYGLIIHHIIQGVYPSTRNHESVSPWKMSFAFNGPFSASTIVGKRSESSTLDYRRDIKT